jgi:hypothetical protein
MDDRSPASTVLWDAPTPCRSSRRTSFPSLGDTTPCACVRFSRKPDADLGPGVFRSGNPAARRCRDGNGRNSQVPGEPLRAYALFSDPGETELIRPYNEPAWPPHATRRRLPRCGNFGAEWHGLGTGCLRFVRRIARKQTQDSLLVAGQALPDGIGYPQGSYERFPRCFLHLILLPQASPGAGCVPFSSSAL